MVEAWELLGQATLRGQVLDTRGCLKTSVCIYAKIVPRDFIKNILRTVRSESVRCNDSDEKKQLMVPRKRESVVGMHAPF